MKKLTKDQIAKRDELLAAMQEKHEELQSAVGDFNSALDEAWGDVETKQAELSTAIQEANEFLGELALEADSYFDGKSEKWQEGDAGSKYSDWKDHFQNEIEEVDELDKPDELECPDLEIEEFENLPEQPE